MLNRIKKMLIIILIPLVLMSCTNNVITTPDDDIIIRVIVKNQSHDFWAVVEMGTEAAGREFGVMVEYIGPASEEDIDGQIRMVEAAIEDEVDAIVLAAIDYEKLVPAAEKAKTSGIPVIIIDSNINSDRMDSFIGTDNVDAGRVLGQSMIDVMGTDIDIAIMSFVKGAASSNEREKGVMAAINQYTNINVLDILYCNSVEDIAKEKTIETINKYPNIDAFVCLNAYATVGTARGIVELEKAGKIKIIGFDSTPEEISYLETDVIELLVVQNPFSMGYLGVKYALDVINGVSVPEVISTEAEVINKENMYLPENQKLVFPFVD